ncbi:hypothetical protein MAP00_005499 [Monascus purpureus]|nr:hypothetical protein MAP00_005499 [Monascus purpureus]
MLIPMHDRRDNLLLTVGDAISSFLQNPDPTTAGQYMLSIENKSKDPAYPWTLSVHTAGKRQPPLPTPVRPGHAPLCFARLGWSTKPFVWMVFSQSVWHGWFSSGGYARTSTL